MTANHGTASATQMCPRSSLPSARAQSSVPSAPSNVKAAGSCREGHAVFAEASLPWVLEQQSASVCPGSGEGPAGVCHHRVSPGRQGTALVAVVLRKASARPSAPPAHPRSPPRLFHDDREARLFPGHRREAGAQEEGLRAGSHGLAVSLTPWSFPQDEEGAALPPPTAQPATHPEAVCEDRCPRSLLEDAAAHWRS